MISQGIKKFVGTIPEHFGFENPLPYSNFMETGAAQLPGQHALVSPRQLSERV